MRVLTSSVEKVDSPAEDLGDQESLDVLCSEKDGGDSGDHDKASHDGVAVTKALRNETVDEKTDDLSDVGTIAETCLPACRYLVCSIGQQHTVLLVELGVSVEGTEETDVVTFHRNAGRDEDTPEDSLGVQLDALQESHTVLLLGSDLGVCNGRVHGLGVIEVILFRKVQRFATNFCHGE